MHTGPAGSAGSTGRTGIRATVPQDAQPTSGCGHSLTRAQAPQRTATHVSDQVRCVSGRGAAARSRGGVTGLPQAHGKTGAA
ncbi:hypothetical protein [Streptomyces sp. 2132.2]|uniref:hypothetical protein n=1 Tax=Streptomyces sp. 2132.2 TaxID=2485161 RepID=UPI0021A7D4CC|nr:hypothetical protein [Streptomyces sp. 2132.2]